MAISGVILLCSSLKSDISDLKEVVLANAEQISSLGKTVLNLSSVTSDLVGYSINQQSDIQTVHEELQAFKRRVDNLDNQ
ncbi:hypothetical protein [Acaryochloris sp. IP29b_bin.148]|uniref:hypothetical protein n=1 Tax=Acaryochloris sp. IP29b_bin.148 TaxID=2969218 RepID=UPI0026098D08|nr:hypothetical protein [Acaryochloris sp. IP29b_bin.148]